MSADPSVELARPDPVARARALRELVRAHADEADRDRHLPAPVARAFAREGLYRIAAPFACGGKAADPMTQIATIEAVSEADGSAGWNLMIGVETFGLLAPGLGRCSELIADPEVILCSSTAAVGRADQVPGGWRINGQWQFVSGCHNSDVFGATVRLYGPDGEPVPGTSNVYAMLERGHFEILDTWHVNGMRGSGSHDIRVRDEIIPDTRIVMPMGGAAQSVGTASSGAAIPAQQRVGIATSSADAAREQALFRFPLGPRLAYNKVAVALGIARAALDAFNDLATGKVPRFTSKTLRDRALAQHAAAAAEIRVRAARALVMAEVTELWHAIVAGATAGPRQLAIFQAACSQAVADTCTAVDLIADAAGTTANMQGHPLERASRDIRVVRQHATVASHHIGDAGRVLLGLTAEGLMLRGLKLPD